MKRIRCESCAGIWMVEDVDLEKQKVCPYCEISIQGKVEFEKYDSLDKAIYGAIIKLGIDVVQNPRQMFGFMLDVAPTIKKEIRIFSKTVTDDYIGYIKEVFEQDIQMAEVILKKLKCLFIEEEGVSEFWADMIYQGLWGAVLYYKGVGCTNFINIQVDDFENIVPRNDKSFTSMAVYPESMGNVNPYKKVSVEFEVKDLKGQEEKKSVFVDSIIPELLGDEKNSLDFLYNYEAEKLYEQALKYYRGEAHYLKDEKKAIKLLREAANYHQYVPAYLQLGRIFLKKRKFDNSLKWYKKAAEVGDVEGCCMMGFFYQNGYGGVRQNTSTAVRYYMKAASTGSKDYMVSISKKFMVGQDVPKDEMVAASILNVSAK